MAEDDDALAATLAGDSGALPALSSAVVGSLLPSSTGKRLADRYEILGLLGVGGMGSVYRARDLELDETVALKVLAEGQDASFLDRFRQEVKLARRVTHRNVARTYDIGEHGAVHFLTMELVEGEPLSKLIAREHRLSVARTIALARELCHGLHAAHGAQVLHRDLKPDNILLGADGRVVITDFGIARAMADAPTRTQGMILGTPVYMAPEQVEAGVVIDARVDIYALGAILFEMLTGRRAWDGDSPLEVATARLLHPPPDPRALCPDLPRSVADVVLRCMQRRPQDRFSDVEALSRALAELALLSASEGEPRSLVQTPSARSPATAPSFGEPLVQGVTPSGLLGSPHAEKTLAVLPFRNGGPSDDDYVAEGLTEDLIDSLSMIRDLRVRSRGAVVHLRGKTGDARDLGRDLDVRVVVEGSVRRAAELVRVAVRLVSVTDGFQIWAKRFDRPMGELLLVADEAAEAIAHALTVERIHRAGAIQDPEVVDLYLRARHEYHRHWAGGNARAVDLFAQAAARAPTDPRILGGYALALMRRFNMDSTAHESAAAAAREMADRALEIDPQSAEAHVARGGVAWGFGDGPTAAREALAAYRANPGLPEAHEYYGRLLLEAGRVEEGIARLKVAIALEPEAHSVLSELARGYALLGDVQGFNGVIGRPPTEPAALNVYWLSALRFTMWRRDAEGLFELDVRMMAGSEFELRPIVHRACEHFRTRQQPVEMMYFFHDRASGGAHAVRRRAFAAQLRAEVGALFDDREAMLTGVRLADEAQLMDIAWLDLCPLLAPLHGDADFEAVRDRTRARAGIVSAILPRIAG